MKKRECDGRGNFTIRKRLNRLLLGAAFSAAAVLVIPSVPQAGMMGYVEAEESISGNTVDNTPTIDRTSDRIINNDDRGDADADMLYYMQSLEVRYHLDAKIMEKLHKVFDSAVYYMVICVKC